MSKNQYDLVVLGGGTAGYVAAIRASQLGKKVAIVERQLLGGTCLHKGCIPTKSLLKSAEVIHTVTQSSEYGIKINDFSIDFNKIMQRKTQIVNQMFQGVQHLMKQNHIDIFNGTGRILGSSIFSPQSGTISVEYTDGQSELLTNQFVLIATGSRPTELPFLPFDHHTVLSSDDVLNLDTLPHSIAIIGAGVIGLEFASLMIDLGVHVHVIESSSRVLPTESERISQAIQKALEQRGVHFHLNVELTKDTVNITTEKIDFTLKDNQIINVDKVLVAVGRKPNTSDIGLNNTKITCNDAGYININKFQQTEEQHIYAAGDCIGKLQLAHVGSKEGIVAVEHMFEHNPIPIDYQLMPKCVYTYPEIASIGMNDNDATVQDIEFERYTLPLRANGKAMIVSADNQAGFIDVIVRADDKEIIGIQMFGTHVTELINEAALLQFMNGSALELGLTTHAHPSMSEILMEAGLKIENRAIHV